ncbi:MAG: DUF998 domain-containing protein [Bacteroidota bacterium]
MSSNRGFTASCFLAAFGDFVVTFALGAYYPGYSALHEPESHLGIAGSPVAHLMNTWGLIFCLLLIVFSYGLFTKLPKKSFWINTVIICIVVYAIGEGAVSALFPFNHNNGELTASGWMHTIFGVFAGIAIASIPFAGTRIFPKNLWPRMNIYSMLSFWFGLILCFIFTISHSGIIPFMGLWQRLFIFDYHLYLSVLAIVLLHPPHSAPYHNIV